jgi:hypothetical protein
MSADHLIRRIRHRIDATMMGMPRRAACRQTGRRPIGAAMRARRTTALAVGALLALAACTSSSDIVAGSASRSGGGASEGTASSTAAVSGSTCPMAFDASEADFYPIQPSFSAGYTVAAQSLNSTTEDWAYVISGDFPYSQWMAWYLYSTKGVPLFKFSDSAIKPDPGSTNPYVVGSKVLAPERSYHIYLMPSDTPSSVVSSMQSQGKNVTLLPAASTTPGVSIVSRSYWSFSNDDLGSYDRFGYGGPTNTPAPTITAFVTDPTSGELTETPVDNCSAQSQLPKKIWYNPETKAPVITFKDAPVPTQEELADLPHYLVQTGSGAGSFGKEFPPSPVADEVQFYRNVASSSPYADVQSAPAPGDPPDACGGYVMANLPNDVVSLVHIPQVPSFPSYKGATADTVNQSTDYQVQFYSVVVYGATKQLDAYGTNDNSQIGNSQIATAPDGSATVVLWPESATTDQVEKIAAVVKANGWNLLKSGTQTAVAPNLLVIREKGQNATWKNALSANSVTQGAPCPQSTNPSLPLPQDPPSAQVTQFNGMGLSAPQGQNCTVAEFLSGACLKSFGKQLAKTGGKWSATSSVPPEQVQPSG